MTRRSKPNRGDGRAPEPREPSSRRPAWHGPGEERAEFAFEHLLGRDFAELRADLRADPRAPLYRLGAGELAAVLSEALAAWSARTDLARAEAELIRVHRLELARLLESASRLRAASESCGALFPYDPPEAPAPRTFAARALEALELMRLDRLELPEAALLVRLLCADPVRWPGAVELAGAALSLDRGRAGEVALGEALLAAGDPAGAARVFLTLARAPWSAGAPAPAARCSSGARWRALSGLACAHEGRGADRLALGACEAAAAEPGCGAGALVSRLFLALVAGDLGRARRASDDLDRAPAARAGALGAALCRLRTRVEIGRGGLPFAAPRAVAGWLSARASAGPIPSAGGSDATACVYTRRAPESGGPERTRPRPSAEVARALA